MIRRHSCFNCSACCSSIYKINEFFVEGVQANTFRAFASNLDQKSPKYLLHANALANLYGIDVDHTSAVIAWAMECYEKGILTKKDTDGIDLKWGNGKAVIELIQQISFRKGFGDILAQGVYEASKIIGRGSEDYTVLSKHNALMEAAMRSHKGWALGILTSTKGGGYLRGATGQEFQKVLPELSKELFNIDDIQDPTSYDFKPELVVWQERYKGIVDIMGICASMSMWMDVTLFTPGDIAEFYYYITGESISVEELMLIGEKLQTIERMFNLLHAGFGRKDDFPPKKLVENPVTQGPYKGEKLDLVKFNEMLDKYYKLHKWDAETGCPTSERLKELGLESIAKKVKEKMPDF
ncbi:MAG: aldehyde ferredoxin oxidoreductase C-terminal domain-containing protein [Candidatus Atribacteria bacterium]|nr:aldehyde ferredoxin oxidoreductase C-terminal domain-containing protein [Candidatus Atribacteria bacterium]